MTSATPHEITLIEAMFEQGFLDINPDQLIGDTAYASDALDRVVADKEITMISPYRRSRKTPTKDGRPPRRARRCWKVERLFAGLQNFRRLVVRYEYYPENYHGFVLLGCIRILLRYL